MTNPKFFSSSDIIEGKMYAVLGYLSIFCILPLILKKSNGFVLAHGKQGLVLFVAEVGAVIVNILLPVLCRPLVLVLLVYSFVGIIAAIRGRFVALPLVADIADKITL